MNLIVQFFCAFKLMMYVSAIIVDSAASSNKTKRTLVDTANYGDKPTPIFYAAISDAPRPEFFATTKTFALAKPPPPLTPVFDPEVPKQVAAQQVLYEYQQTPTNSVSNVHVKQLFQPLETEGNNNNNNNNNGQVQTSETVVNPVQHSSLINHGQNYAHVQLQPYFPQHTQTQHYVPGKFFYVNGKYVYPPYNHHQNVASNNKPAISYVTYGNPGLPKQKLTPPPTGTPMNYNNINNNNNKFVPPQKQDMQQITKPIQQSARVHEEVEEEETSAEKEDEQNEEIQDEEDDKSNNEETSDEDRDHYGRYYEDDDHGDYYKDDHERSEEDDEDSDRRDSKVVKVQHKSPKSRKNNPNKKSHNDKNNYSWSESFSHSSKFENGKKKSDKKKESKKYDNNKKKGGKRKNNKSRKGYDRLEGRYSHNVPVIQEHNVFREKWYLSKSRKPDKKF